MVQEQFTDETKDHVAEIIAERNIVAARTDPDSLLRLTPEELEVEADRLLEEFSRVPSEERITRGDLVADITGSRISIGESFNEGAKPITDTLLKDLTAQVLGVLESLSERERSIMRSSFGLDDGRSRSEKEIGQEMGISEEEVKESMKKALQKLGHPARIKTLKDYLE